MANIKLEHVAKVYSNGVRAVDDFNMEINDKEFIVFVGPSGCGKSTTLRMIAGLEEITEGTISIDDVVVNTLEPKDRDISMVFQNYALYPHMSVYTNMAYGLKLRKVPMPVKEFNGEPVFCVDKKTLEKHIQQREDLTAIMKIYGKEASPDKIEKTKERIEEFNKLIEADKEKLQKDKISYKEYCRARKNWLGLVSKQKKNPSSVSDGDIDLAKKAVDESKKGLVPAYKYKHYTKEEIDRRVHEAADILGITEYLKRKPKAMSGGQRQRVALGRCIVREPKVFLLDEPLSNLDAKLRASMRVEISKLHDKLQTTFVYVTHDQIEAMTMGTRIVVMKDGVVQQIDTPTNLYNHPCNKFVAGFIGTPQMNFYQGSITNAEGGLKIKFDDTSVEAVVSEKPFANIPQEYLNGEKQVCFGIRSEHLSVENSKDKMSAKAKISYIEELGVNSQIYVDFNLENEFSLDESKTRGIIKAEPQCGFKNGQIIDVYFDLNHLFVFDKESEVSLSN